MIGSIDNLPDYDGYAAKSTQIKSKIEEIRSRKCISFTLALL